jgi:raffinose/stachyose/melibiose transport system permease protein
MEESAVIDGCSPTRAFFSIILPLLQPVTMTSIVTIAIGVWNDFILPLYMLSSSKHWTLPLTVYNFFGQYSSNWNYVFANLMLTAVPMIILYMLLQKYIIDGLTAGSVKG